MILPHPVTTASCHCSIDHKTVTCDRFTESILLLPRPISSSRACRTTPSSRSYSPAPRRECARTVRVASQTKPWFGVIPGVYLQGGCAIGSGDGAVAVERVGLIRRAGADRGGAVAPVFVPITLARRSERERSLQSTGYLLAVASSGRTQPMRTRGGGSYGYLTEASSRESHRGISVVRIADSKCWGGKGGTRILQPTRLRRYHHRYLTVNRFFFSSSPFSSLVLTGRRQRYLAWVWQR